MIDTGGPAGIDEVMEMLQELLERVEEINTKMNDTIEENEMERERLMDFFGHDWTDTSDYGSGRSREYDLLDTDPFDGIDPESFKAGGSG